MCPIMNEMDTGNRILKTAHDLFMQYGIRTISMDDIAQKLGVSKKTIYQYYKDKDELVEEVVKQEIGHNQQACEKDRSVAKNAIHEIFMSMDMVVEMFSRMNPSVLHDLQKYHPGAFRIFLKHKNDYLYNIIHQNMLRGIEEGLYRKDLHITVLSHFRVDSMLLPFNPEFMSKVKAGMVETEEQLILLYLFGLASPKGYKLINKYQQERIKKKLL